MQVKEVNIGDKVIGGTNHISVQSMCNTPTKNSEATIKQIHELEKEGCEIIRVSVPDIESAKALKIIKANISIPLVADIHFDYKLAIKSAQYVDKLRINPGNIGERDKVIEVIKAAKEYSIPIRIGINLGSIERSIERKYGLTAEAMVKSAEEHIKILEDNDFTDIVVSLKSSDINKMIDSNKLFVKKYSYPLHIGVTEAGSVYSGTIKNAIGIGVLLEQGIGSTIRVSLSADPVEEVKAGWQILKALNLRQRGINVVSCPTCARTNINVVTIVNQLENQLKRVTKNIKIAIMGCMVNGLGEAKEADIGIVGKKNTAFLYKSGKLVKELSEKDIVETILKITSDL